MADRSVKVVLNAQVQGYVDGMNKASQATKQVSAEGEKLTASSPSMQALGGVLLGVGTAVTAIGIAAYKTGIEYNTMQQTTRAALTTLLGSAEAANAQMDKLDDFARNSPFAKQVFITAQQQMIGFGVAAEDVIPALDAIQNAVAAMGGSNEQISAISEIMARIKSESRLSGDALQRLGYYGIDAAAIIGSEMGKTAVEIREMASKPGGIPADEIWDPLVNGLQNKFGGAAANVKETFDGAIDRVKAAWRDFSSELAKPLVDPNGGGALVDLLNWSADMMRGFQKLPQPVKDLTTSLILLGGAAALAGGAAILAVPQWVAFTTALATMRATSSLSLISLKSVWTFLTSPWGIALVGATLALKVFNNALDASKTSATQFEVGLKQGKSALDLMTASAEDNERGLTVLFADVEQHYSDLPGLFDKAATSGRGFWSSMSFNENAALDTIANFGSELARLARTDLPSAQKAFKEFSDEAGLNTAQAMTALNEEMPELKNALIDIAAANGLATDDATLLKIALGELEPATNAQAEALQEVSGAADDASGEIRNLDEIIRNFGSATLDAREAEREFQQAIDDATAAVAENGATLDITTEAGRKNQAALDAMAMAANDSAAANYSVSGSEEQLRAQLDASREKLIAAAIQFGLTEDEARIYADQVLATPETVLTTANFEDTAARQRVQAWKNLVASIPGAVARGEYGNGLGVLLPGANGMMNTYANGGIQSFAGGGFPTGIYSGGTPIHKFAEPETRWEAYISGKSGQEARNRQIWVEAGRRLGMGAMSGSSDGNATSSLGRNPIVLNVYDVDNRLIGSMDARVAGALAPVSSGAVRDVMGVR